MTNYTQIILEKKATALLVFTAEWCRPCQLQKPVIENLQKIFSQQVLIEMIDVDEHSELSDKFSAKTLPTSVLFAQGEIVETLAGFQSEEFLSSYLTHILGNIEQAKKDAVS